MISRSREKWHTWKWIAWIWLAGFLVFSVLSLLNILAVNRGSRLLLGQYTQAYITLLIPLFFVFVRFANWFWHIRPLAKKVRCADWRLCPKCTYPYEGDGHITCAECGEQFLGWQTRQDWQIWIKPSRLKIKH